MSEHEERSLNRDYEGHEFLYQPRWLQNEHLKFLHQSSLGTSTYIPISKYQLPAPQHLVLNQVLVNWNHDCLPEMTGNCLYSLRAIQFQGMSYREFSPRLSDIRAISLLRILPQSAHIYEMKLGLISVSFPYIIYSIFNSEPGHSHPHSRLSSF
jgi:hypothetical protein